MPFTQNSPLCSESSDDRTTDNFCNYIKITKLCEPRVCCHWDGKQKKNWWAHRARVVDSHSRSRNLLRSTIFANFLTQKKSRVGIPLVYNFHCLRWNSSKAIKFCRSMEPFRGLALSRETSSHRFHVFLSFYLISDKYKRSFFILVEKSPMNGWSILEVSQRTRQRLAVFLCFDLLFTVPNSLRTTSWFSAWDSYFFWEREAKSRMFILINCFTFVRLKWEKCFLLLWILNSRTSSRSRSRCSFN